MAFPNSPTQKLSSLLEKILTPLLPKLKSYIKDEWDILKKLPRNFDPNFTLLTCDIFSLHANIPHKLGLKSDSHVSENFCQIKIFPSLVRKNTIICLFGV